MSMFKTLAPFAQRSLKSVVTVTLFDAGGGNLRVIVSEKKSDTKDDHVPLNLSITGTPDELDAELPLAIAEGAALPAKSISEQVKTQTAEAAAERIGELDHAPKKKPAAKSTGKITTPKQAAKKKTPATKAAPATKSPVIKPLIKAAPTEKPAKAVAKKPAHGPAKQSVEEKKAACLADLRKALTTHGANVTRKQYAAMAKTGRSYETAFGTWEKFRASVEVHVAAAPDVSARVAKNDVPKAAADILRDVTVVPATQTEIDTALKAADAASPAQLALTVQGEEPGLVLARAAINLF